MVKDFQITVIINFLSFLDYQNCHANLKSYETKDNGLRILRKSSESLKYLTYIQSSSNSIIVEIF